ncbi:MAG: CDP-alcohol phosphatidyltransferase family protein [Reinekea sp.]|jgi:phosphatidylglycerophosphate synthase
MLDRWTVQLIKPPLNVVAKALVKANIKADHVTMAGFGFGILVIPVLAWQKPLLALLLLGINRLFDGLDGAIARQSRATERGAYLDIVLDFIFYSGFIFGFALADPSRNALPAAALIFSFMGTGSSFLAFAIFAEKLNLSSMVYPNKGFFYLSGITEGTETILFFILMCLAPDYFPILAWLFFILCVVTTVTRVIGGAHTIEMAARQRQE